jgi:hypothetical protein
MTEKWARGDIYGPWKWDLYGERWLKFDRAATELGDKLAISPSAAEAKLHKLCASGVIRAIGGDGDDDKPPEPIPPSEWADDDLPRLEVLAGSIDNPCNRPQAVNNPASSACLQRCFLLACLIAPIVHDSL